MRTVRFVHRHYYALCLLNCFAYQTHELEHDTYQIRTNGVNIILKRQHLLSPSFTHNKYIIYLLRCSLVPSNGICVLLFHTKRLYSGGNAERMTTFRTLSFYRMFHDGKKEIDDFVLRQLILSLHVITIRSPVPECRYIFNIWPISQHTDTAQCLPIHSNR